MHDLRGLGGLLGAAATELGLGGLLDGALGAADGGDTLDGVLTEVRAVAGLGGLVGNSLVGPVVTCQYGLASTSWRRV